MSFAIFKAKSTLFYCIVKLHAFEIGILFDNVVGFVLAKSLPGSCESEWGLT